MADKRRQAGPVRSDRLLRKKYTQYLIPAMITYAALSLNEFVDSMLVSNLLDSDAMGVINLGLPVVLVMSAAYAMLGTGGANEYAVSLGKRTLEAAGSCGVDPEPDYVLKTVREKIGGFVEDAEQFDDLTMLCMKYR